MTSLAPSAAPANALKMWADNARIYVELPGSPPHILAFAYSEAGLSKALAILRQRKFEYAGEPMLVPEVMVPVETALQSILRRRGLL